MIRKNILKASSISGRHYENHILGHYSAAFPFLLQETLGYMFQVPASKVTTSRQSIRSQALTSASSSVSSILRVYLWTTRRNMTCAISRTKTGHLLATIFWANVTVHTITLKGYFQVRLFSFHDIHFLLCLLEL